MQLGLYSCDHSAARSRRRMNRRLMDLRGGGELGQAEYLSGKKSTISKTEEKARFVFPKVSL